MQFNIKNYIKNSRFFKQCYIPGNKCFYIDICGIIFNCELNTKDGFIVNKKSLAMALLSFVMWGVAPFYWNQLSHVSSVLILCFRVVGSFLFTLVLLGAVGGIKRFTGIFRSKQTLRALIISGILITANWTVYIYAVTNNHTIEASIGYFMDPLFTCAMGIAVFREKCSKLQLTALCMVALGIVISMIMFGSFPIISLLIGTAFGLYSTVKKLAHADAVAGFAVETMVTTPLMIAIAAVFFKDAIMAATVHDWTFLLIAGPFTAIPMMLYSKGINDLNLNTVGFLYNICPTMQLISGCILGEAFTLQKAIPFGFAILALVLYFTDTMIKRKAEKQLTAS